MHKSPLNTKILYEVVRDWNNGPHSYSETMYAGEDLREAKKTAKWLGEDVVWHIIEKKVVLCSDRAETEREARLELAN
jgi:hypothetical protein